MTAWPGHSETANPTCEPSEALGRQLAAECNSCHGSLKSAIPSLSGRSETQIATLLKMFASGKGSDGNPGNMVMVSVAQSLDDTQMLAVSHYLATHP